MTRWEVWKDRLGCLLSLLLLFGSIFAGCTYVAIFSEHTPISPLTPEVYVAPRGTLLEFTGTVVQEEKEILKTGMVVVTVRRDRAENNSDDFTKKSQDFNVVTQKGSTKIGDRVFVREIALKRNNVGAYDEFFVITGPAR